ncbi:MAG: hypothetical protein KDH92_05055 [Chloroflexi bacterium]|nr:hypothetical protein [Chloroflexota bacterium]
MDTRCPRQIARPDRHGRPRLLPLLGFVALLVGLSLGNRHASATRASASGRPELERVAAPRACFVRLPDLPAPRYGGFGAYNPESRVLAYAGGGAKLSDDNTMTYHDLFAIQLDPSSAGWRTLPYGSGAGYTRELDHGCREMASVQIDAGLALSVLGKDGCDNGRIDSGRKGGDLVSLAIGRAASNTEVRWLPGGNAAQLPRELAGNKGRLTRLFAAYDSLRERVLFGQGTFDSAVARDTLDAVFSAQRSGNVWRVQRLRPRGEAPSPRYGSCAAYVRQPEAGVDGLIVVGGKLPGMDGADLAEVWWLDFARGAAGEWREISERFGNLDALGPRREGACAYDPESRRLYSWMGRASKDIEAGAKRSAGLWQVDLTNLGDAGAVLSWERLAPDDLEGVTGRRLIPSVWDPIDKRLFAIGGRNDLDELADVWAIYPNVSPARCASLDPYVAFAGEDLPAPPTPEEPTPTAVDPPEPRPTRTPPGPGRSTPGPVPSQSATREPAPEPSEPRIGEPFGRPAYLPALMRGSTR